MKTAEHAFFGSGLVVLNKLHVNTGFFIIIVIIGFHEIASLIPENGRGDDLQTFDLTSFHCNFSHFFVLLILS